MKKTLLIIGILAAIAIIGYFIYSAISKKSSAPKDTRTPEQIAADNAAAQKAATAGALGAAAGSAITALITAFENKNSTKNVSTI